MASNNFLSVSELDFFALKENLKTFLKGKPEYSDYNFDGSNFSVLLELLSYNTYMNSFYLNQVGSEMFLDTAKIKESVVSHAKELNYVPRSRASAQSVVDLIVAAPDNPISITIPKYFSFSTVIDSTTLTFSTNETLVITPMNGVYRINDVSLYEGEIVNEFFTVSNDTTIFPLRSENINISSIVVTVYSDSSLTDPVVYSRAEDLFGLNSTSEVYFVEGYRANQYQLVFSASDTIGKKLNNSNVIKVTYRDTVGSLGNGAFSFSPKGTISGRAVSVVTKVSSRYGAERESLNEIKYNAPRHFQTQNRTVTGDDYRIQILSRFSEIEDAIAYGGELATPPQYGKVIISVKPFGSNQIISSSLSNRIKNFLKGKNLTTEPEIVNPEFFYVNVNSTVYYDRNIIDKNVLDIRSDVISSILNFNNTDLNGFGKNLRVSKLSSAIDNTNVAIVSNDTTAKLVKRISPIANKEEVITFSFGNMIKALLVPSSQEQPLGHPPMFTSTPFIVEDSFGSDVIVRLQDNGRGTLFIFTTKPDSTIITIYNNVGTIDYKTGDVYLKLKIKSYVGSYISLLARTVVKDILSSKNSYLLIDSADVNVTMTEMIT
jgi:hypothetical protein